MTTFQLTGALSEAGGYHDLETEKKATINIDTQGGTFSAAEHHSESDAEGGFTRAVNAKGTVTTADGSDTVTLVVTEAEDNSQSSYGNCAPADVAGSLLVGKSFEFSISQLKEGGEVKSLFVDVTVKNCL